MSLRYGETRIETRKGDTQAPAGIGAVYRLPVYVRASIMGHGASAKSELDER